MDLSLLQKRCLCENRFYPTSVKLDRNELGATAVFHGYAEE